MMTAMKAILALFISIALSAHAADPTASPTKYTEADYIGIGIASFLLGMSVIAAVYIAYERGVFSEDNGAMKISRSTTSNLNIASADERTKLVADNI
jgi:hypothetical protein